MRTTTSRLNSYSLHFVLSLTRIFCCDSLHFVLQNTTIVLREYSKLESTLFRYKKIHNRKILPRPHVARPLSAPLALSFGIGAGQVYGTAAGGYADELRLLSTNETYINLRAHGGSLDFVSTKVCLVELPIDWTWRRAVAAAVDYIRCTCVVIVDTSACDHRACTLYLISLD